MTHWDASPAKCCGEMTATRAISQHTVRYTEPGRFKDLWR